MTPAPLRAIIWCAVSTRPQAGADKISLEDQESAARAICEKNAWHIVAVLRVPGFSRDYFTIAECAEAMAADGIYAFRQLKDLIDTRAIDVLLTYGGDRFAREQSLHAEVVGRLINAGAKLLLTRTGEWIDASSARGFTALDGYRTASEKDNLKQRHETGLNGRLARGFFPARPPFSHVLIRDNSGRPAKVELRPGLERFWADLASFVLAGHGYDILARLMHEAGHRHPDTGGVLHEENLRRLLHSPTTWGHLARRSKGKAGAWAFDEKIAAPPGVLIVRNCIPPVWNGPLAESIQAELRRRADVFRGSARPKEHAALSGLLVCASCGRRMVHTAIRRKGKRARAGSMNIGVAPALAARRRLFAGRNAAM